MRRRGDDQSAGSGSALTTAAISGAWAELMDELPDGLVLVDADGVVRLVNTRAERLLGRPRGLLLGGAVTDVLPLTDHAGRSWWDVGSPWVGLPTRSGHRERVLTVPGAGSLVVSMRYVRPVRSGPVERVVISLREVRGRRRAETAVAEVIAVAGHELRGPLSSVRGFSSTLLRQWDRFTDAQRRTMVATIEADADHLSRLLLELMDVARLGTSRLPLHESVFDLQELAREQLNRLIVAGAAGERFAPIEGGAPTGTWVRADRDRVTQIIGNLIDNALRHGEGLITLSLDVDEPGMVGVRVCDEGPGVDPGHYHDVFRKFWHGSRPDSTGLGLHLVKGLVEAHGGTVSVGPADVGPRPGARFRITLPAADVPERQVSQQ